MAWNGTVTCSYCYSSGHNKRGCPRLKARIAEAREEDPDSWQVRHYDNHRESTSRKGETRTCSYCQEVGHNRRTCPPLTAHAARLVEGDAAWRSRLLDEMRSSTVGVGSVLQLERWSGAKQRFIVTGYRWEQLGFTTRRSEAALTVRNLSKLGAGETSCPFPADVGTTMVMTNRNITVLGARRGDTVNPPAGWEAMTPKAAKKLLKGCHSYNFDRHFGDELDAIIGTPVDATDAPV